jgi:hypothetical protein
MKSLKIFLSIIICAPIFLSCTDKINTQIREKVESSDHDSRLYGWWQRINDESSYRFFDSIDFKMFYGKRNEAGELEKEAKSLDYWYTENDSIMHIVREATLLTGKSDFSFEYRISEDGNTFLEKSLGTFVPSMTRAR